jgi:glycosyltransferase involved in cell wall biosynthesis
MKVSVIVPTLDRQAWLPNVVRMFKAQTWKDKELLIYDDSAQPATALREALRNESSIRYVHLPTPLSLGLKLNELVAAASGDVVMKWDDDDYYAPRYVATMVDYLQGHDFVKLSNWYTWSPKDGFFGYYDTGTVSTAHYRLAPKDPVSLVAGGSFSPELLEGYRWGYGFTYVFRKAVHEQARFNDQNWCSDIEFYKRVRAAGFKAHARPDESGLALHLIHERNLSCIFPQYRLPDFMLTSIFGADAQAMGKLCIEQSLLRMPPLGR